jgi:hypothetical protein
LVNVYILDKARLTIGLWIILLPDIAIMLKINELAAWGVYNLELSVITRL